MNKILFFFLECHDMCPIQYFCLLKYACVQHILKMLSFYQLNSSGTPPGYSPKVNKKKCRIS